MKAFNGFESVDVVPCQPTTLHLINDRRRMPRNIFDVRANSIGSMKWIMGGKGKLIIPIDKTSEITALIAVDDKMVERSTREQRKRIGFGMLWLCRPTFTDGPYASAGGDVGLELDTRVA